MNNAMAVALVTKTLQDLQPGDVRSVYTGKPGCMCGCNGYHLYAAAHRAEASTDRGYTVLDEEVSDRDVTRILREVQALDKLEVAEDGAWSLRRRAAGYA